MATSGVSTFNATRNEIIRQAALLVNAIGAGQTMGAPMLNDFAFALNAMVKRWSSTGLHVWTTTEGVLFPQPGQIKYGAGGGATDHITTQYNATTISADEAVGQTVIGLTSTSDIAINDFIGITLDDGTLQWTTVTVVGASTVTILAALTDSAAALNGVYTYTNKIGRPLKVVGARRYSIESGADTPIGVTARMDYLALPIKTEAGSINQMFYDAQLSTGYFYIWQVPATATELLKFTWHRPIEDFVTAGDNPDLPQEWIQTLYFNLAAVMLAQFPVPPQRMDLIMSQAEQYLDDLRGFDRENESIFFQPNFDGRLS